METLTPRVMFSEIPIRVRMSEFSAVTADDLTVMVGGRWYARIDNFLHPIKLVDD